MVEIIYFRYGERGMNTDKRNVTTDALEVLGTIIDESIGRDAIHLAVEPVTAGEPLLPGQHIGLINGLAYSDDDEDVKSLGIVDPFLDSGVRQGERFLLIVYPRQITSLRHVWTHPDFPENVSNNPLESPKGISKKWLEDFVNEHSDYFNEENNEDRIKDLTYFLEIVNEYLDDGGSCGLGSGIRTSDEFWHHFEIYTGRKVPSEERLDYFSCSC